VLGELKEKGKEGEGGGLAKVYGVGDISIARAGEQAGAAKLGSFVCRALMAFFVWVAPIKNARNIEI
jgi:hypothetical protein